MGKNLKCIVFLFRFLNHWLISCKTLTRAFVYEHFRVKLFTISNFEEAMDDRHVYDKFEFLSLKSNRSSKKEDNSKNKGIFWFRFSQSDISYMWFNLMFLFNPNEKILIFEEDNDLSFFILTNIRSCLKILARIGKVTHSGKSVNNTFPSYSFPLDIKESLRKKSVDSENTEFISDVPAFSSKKQMSIDHTLTLFFNFIKSELYDSKCKNHYTALFLLSKIFCNFSGSLPFNIFKKYISILMTSISDSKKDLILQVKIVNKLLKFDFPLVEVLIEPLYFKVNELYRDLRESRLTDETFSLLIRSMHKFLSCIIGREYRINCMLPISYSLTNLFLNKQLYFNFGDIKKIGNFICTGIIEDDSFKDYKTYIELLWERSKLKNKKKWICSFIYSYSSIIISSKFHSHKHSNSSIIALFINDIKRLISSYAQISSIKRESIREGRQGSKSEFTLNISSLIVMILVNIGKEILLHKEKNIVYLRAEYLNLLEDFEDLTKQYGQIIEKDFIIHKIFHAPSETKDQIEHKPENCDTILAIVREKILFEFTAENSREKILSLRIHSPFGISEWKGRNIIKVEESKTEENKEEMKVEEIPIFKDVSIDKSSIVNEKGKFDTSKREFESYFDYLLRIQREEDLRTHIRSKPSYQIPFNKNPEEELNTKKFSCTFYLTKISFLDRGSRITEFSKRIELLETKIIKVDICVNCIEINDFHSFNIPSSSHNEEFISFLESLGNPLTKNEIEKTMSIKASLLPYWEKANRIVFDRKSLCHFFFIESIEQGLNPITILWCNLPEHIGNKELPNCLKTIIDHKSLVTNMHSVFILLFPIKSKSLIRVEIYEMIDNYDFKKKNTMPLHSGMIIPIESLNHLLKLALINLSMERKNHSFSIQIGDRCQFYYK